MPDGKTYNVLFLCSGNSARSIMAEAILKRLGAGKFNAYSAGSDHVGELNPYAVELLQQFNHPIGELKSKDWRDFSGDGAPKMDFVVNFSQTTADTDRPAFQGEHMNAFWAIPDPVKFEGSEVEKRAHFADVYGRIHNRIDIFVNLPIPALDKLALQTRLDDIGVS